MRAFMDKDFLLKTQTARDLFHTYAENTPVLDYHCHINPKEIAQDRQFHNITELWLGGDHYKWRLMRSAGVAEQYITGDASDYDKFAVWARVLGNAIGNPLFHWSHLELQRYFGYTGVLNAQTCEAVWKLCNEKLQQPSMSVRSLIKQSNVTLLCTTDDPADTLNWHKQIADDPSFDVQVLPAWRPDRAMNIEKPDYLDYLSQLETVSRITISDFSSLLDALSSRMDFFASMGCLVSDHGLDDMIYRPAADAEIETIFAKRLAEETLTSDEILKFKTAFMLAAGRQYSRRSWVMQLHYGCKRNNNIRLFGQIGADTGFDCINNATSSAQAADFLNALELTGELPRTILYSLNPGDNEAIGTIIGCFQNGEAVSKIQHGSAWWFNDNKTGIENQIRSLGNLGYLAGFVGMLTDSRSFISYPRHEYFRRILCNYFGELVENGEYPADADTLGEIITNICYHNAIDYFQFPLMKVKI